LLLFTPTQGQFAWRSAACERELLAASIATGEDGVVHLVWFSLPMESVSDASFDIGAYLRGAEPTEAP